MIQLVTKTSRNSLVRSTIVFKRKDSWTLVHRLNSLSCSVSGCNRFASGDDTTITFRKAFGRDTDVFPQPALALAYDYVDGDDYYDCVNNTQIRSVQTLDSTKTPDNRPSSSPYPPPSPTGATTMTVGSLPMSARKIGGGGGSDGGNGRSRCPKVFKSVFSFSSN